MNAIWKELGRKLGFDDAGAEERSPEGGAELAAAALLLEMTEADMEVSVAERDAVRAALARTFGLSAADIEALLGRAEKAVNRQVSYYPHVETVNALCDEAAKARIVEQMWRVAFADGRLDKYEEHYLRRLCQLIHVPHRVFIQTRHRVEAEQGGEPGAG